jgi:hypothetical protein
MVSTPSPEIAYERELERNRQTRVKFDEQISQIRWWFFYRICAAIVIIFIIFVAFVVSIYIVLNNATFPAYIVQTFAIVLIIDIVGTFLSLVKLIMNPNTIPQFESISTTDESHEGRE